MTCGFDASPGEFSKLTRNTSGTYTRRYPNGTSYGFDATGLLTAIADRYGAATTISRTSGRISSITDPAGQSIQFYYDGSGKILQIATPGSAQRTSAFEVNVEGDLATAWDPDGVRNFLATYSSHRLASLTDRAASVTNFAYATDGNLDFAEAPEITVSGGVQVRPRSTLAAPAKALLVAIAGGTQGTSGAPVPRGQDLRARVTNPRNQTTFYSISRWGSPTQADYPLGPSSTAQFNANGLLTQSVSPTGNVVTYDWMTTPNGGAVLTSVSDATGTVNTEYETVYDRPTRIYGNTVEQTLTYNGVYLATSRVGTNPVATYTFDTFGRVATVTDAGGHMSSRWYGATGLRNTDSSKAGLNITRFYKDSYGRVVKNATPGTRDTAIYDPMNRVIATKNGLNQTTSFSYDSLGLRTVTDARFHSTTYTRNALGWVTSELRAGSSTPLVTAYDANGNVVSVTNRRGQTITMQYDAMDRLISRTTPDGYDITIAYDVVSVGESSVAYHNGESRDTIFTDALGRVARATARRGASWDKRYQLAYSYDTKGLRTGISATSSQWTGEKTQGFGYSAMGALESVTAFGTTTYLGLDGENLPISVTYLSGLEMGRAITSGHGSYKDTFNLADVNQALGVKLSVDGMDRITSRARGVVDTVYTFFYDSAGRLKTVWPTIPMSIGCTPNPDIGFGDCWHTPAQDFPPTTFTYDAVGNLTNGGAFHSAAGNRLDSAYVGTYNARFVYDADGNLIEKHRVGFDQTLMWNSLGQLVNVTTTDASGTRVAQFGYDALGRRVRKTVTGAAPFVFDARYLHDGDNVIARLDAAGDPSADYVFLGVDDPFAMRENGETYYYVRDPVSGSVKGLVRASDNVLAAHLNYAPFGNLESGMNITGNRFWYGGKEYDWETELVYNRARYYDPWVGRFISEDPIGLNGGINLYAYADNDPINATDPMGLFRIRIRLRLFGIRWAHPWADIKRSGAIVAFGAISIASGGSLTPALAALGATALGAGDCCHCGIGNIWKGTAPDFPAQPQSIKLAARWRSDHRTTRGRVRPRGSKRAIPRVCQNP